MNRCYLAGGCFWCIADYLSSFHGIEEINVGYSGGNETTVKYEQVKAQQTGHRETLEIIYDDSISLSEIVDIFLSYVDPYDKDGQFIDKGHSYTLALYYLDENQRELYISKIEELRKNSTKEVYITIEQFKFFIKAEEGHQSYSKKHPEEFYQELINSNRVCHLKKYQK